MFGSPQFVDLPTFQETMAKRGVLTGECGVLRFEYDEE
jgi:hypothetical protein